MSGDKYLFDKFNDGTFALPADIHEDNLARFVHKHASQMRNFESDFSSHCTLFWNALSDPVSLRTEPYQQRTVCDIVGQSRSTHSALNKTMKALVSITLEMQDLVAYGRKVYFPSVALFGEKPTTPVGEGGSMETEPTEGDPQIEIGRLFPYLQELLRYVQRCYAVIHNCMQQLGAVYSLRSPLYASCLHEGGNVDPVMAALAELLASLSYLDEMFASSDALQDSWTAYEKMLAIVQTDPERYGISSDNVARFYRMFEALDGQLMSGRILAEALEQRFESSNASVARNKSLKEMVLRLCKSKTEELAATLASSPLTAKEGAVPEVLCLWALQIQLAGSVDAPAEKKTLKQLWSIVSKAPLGHIMGSYCWNAPLFLKEMTKGCKISDKVKEKDLLDKCLAEAKGSFLRLARTMHLQTSVWLVRLQSERGGKADDGDITSELLTRRSDMLLTGVKLCGQSRALMVQFLHLHLATSKGMSRSEIVGVAQCCEVLKAVQFGVFRNSVGIADCSLYCLSDLRVRMLEQLSKAEAALNSHGGSRLGATNLDILGVSTLCSDVVKGPSSREANAVLDLSLSLVPFKAAAKVADFASVGAWHERAAALSDIEAQLRELCECSVLFWIRQSLPQLFSMVFQHPQTAFRLQFIFSALQDAAPLLLSLHPKTEGEALFKSFKVEVEEAIDAEIVQPACQEIENDLRRHTQKVNLEVNPQPVNPFANPPGQMAVFTRLPPIRFFSSLIDINKRIAHYLNKIFYNLTSIALHDWKVYGEMRGLAKTKYDLDLVESHLPTQTLDQGLDVLEIMRNIHLFVTRYQYNLNNQFFVESASDSNQLRSISIRHISNSIRQHGLGIMNTAVNFTYQFLTRKFELFSQFLFDPQIESLLMREMRSFRDYQESEADTGSARGTVTGGLKSLKKVARLPYPYSRGQKFSMDIRKLGHTSGGESMTYLDLFMKLVTEIGNALGYVRMVRSGGLHYCADAIEFLTSPTAHPELELNTPEDAGFSEATTHAIKNVDAVARGLMHSFAEGTDYFKILVSVFAGEMQSEKNLHLRAFYVFVPALTINYVEKMLSRAKRSKGRVGTFSDDGFAIGLAYILELLGQGPQFDSLQWFDSVSKHFAQTEKELNKKLRDPMLDKETLKMSLRKSGQYEEEFKQFWYSFTASKIFFRA